MIKNHITVLTKYDKLYDTNLRPRDIFMATWHRLPPQDNADLLMSNCNVRQL